MRQLKVSLHDQQIAFINQYKALGFKDRSAMLREALRRMQREIEEARMQESAEIYAELYDEDEDMQAWVEHAAEEWPQ